MWRLHVDHQDISAQFLSPTPHNRPLNLLDMGSLPLSSPSTPSSPESPRTPPEIIDAVVDELASDKKDITSYYALLRCSLVSHQVSLRCRMHIFQEINLGWTKDALTSQDSQSLTSGTVTGLVDILLANPSLSDHILVLRINPAYFQSNPDGDNLCDNLPILLECMPRLRTFRLTAGASPDAPSLPWSWFPAEAQSAIQSCCARPSIKCVEFRGFTEFPSSLIYSCSSSLTTLYLHRTLPVTINDPAEQAGGSPLDVFRLPPWSLQRLVCQNALPLLRSAIEAIHYNALHSERSPFGELQHLNVAVLTHSDSQLVAPLLVQASGSMRRLEVSFSLRRDENAFDTNWVQLPSLHRLHVAVYCKEVQENLHFPPEVPSLMHDVSHHQTSIASLSFHSTCQMTYDQAAMGEPSLVDGDGWQRLAEALTSDGFSHLTALRISISAFLVPQDADMDITRDMCEGVERRLFQEFAARFDCHGRSLSLSISVQSLREIFMTEEWH
ncbi:hypothetical protein NMY22_g8842 [Coprinellus aureogranulatus]|nr:hypothetical protein NMY22_g8842 [Coprinellus aureogranulatus]